MSIDEKPCPRCAETIKSAAVVCKHCGYDFHATASVKPAEKKSKIGKIIGYIALGFIGLIILGSIVGPSDEQGGSSNDAAEVAETSVPPLAVTAQELFRAYEQNEMAAQKKYGGQPLQVEGVIESIELDFMDNPTVSLTTGNMFQNVTLHFDKSYADKAAELSKGQPFVAICSEISEVIGSPQLRKCRF